MSINMKVYAAYADNYDIIKKSSSGGIFACLALQVLNKQGIVYGVGFEDGFEYTHYIRVVDLESISSIMGSKYIQARAEGVYEKVETDLKNNKLVLFSGTPCQINALHLYLGREYDNLISVDLICHGVPSERVWQKYMEYIRNEKGIFPHGINFRDKKYGWQNFGISLTDQKKKYFYSLYDDSYMHFFLQNLSLRPSCYRCQARENRYADITLADFWGINSVDTTMINEEGVSLVIIRTTTGIDVWRSIEVVSKEEDYENAIQFNPCEYGSVNKPDKRERFFGDLNRLSYKQLIKEYYKPSVLGRSKQILKNFLYILQKRKNKSE